MAAAAASFWWCVPSGAVSSKPWLPAYQMPGRPTRSAHVGEVTAGQHRDWTTRGQLPQCLARARGERGRVRIIDDVGQRAVEVEEQRRPSGGEAVDQAERLQRVGQLGHPLVARAHGDVAQIGDNRIGAAVAQRIAVSGPVDTDHQSEPRVARGLDDCGVGRDDDASARSRRQPVGQLGQGARGDGAIDKTRCRHRSPAVAGPGSPRTQSRPPPRRARTAPRRGDAGR